MEVGFSFSCEFGVGIVFRVCFFSCRDGVDLFGFGLDGLEIADNKFSSFDIVSCLEEYEICGEGEEYGWYLSVSVSDCKDVDGSLSSSDHKLVYLVGGNGSQVRPAVVEDEDAVLEVFEYSERVFRVPDVSFDAGELEVGCDALS